MWLRLQDSSEASGVRSQRQMSEILGIDYYDRDIVDQAAKKLKLPISVVDQEEEKADKTGRQSFFQNDLSSGKRNQ